MIARLRSSWSTRFFGVSVEIQLLYIRGVSTTAVSLYDVPKLNGLWGLRYMQINGGGVGFFSCSNCVLCLCFQIAVCPHPVGNVCNSMISKWICISKKCIYVYLCICIYLYVKINRWLCVRVFGFSQNENKNKAVLWLAVHGNNVLHLFLAEMTSYHFIMKHVKTATRPNKVLHSKNKQRTQQQKYTDPQR